MGTQRSLFSSLLPWLLVACGAPGAIGPTPHSLPVRGQFYFSPAPLASSPADEFQPSVSEFTPDILFVSKQSGNLDIFRQSPRQDAPIRLTNHPTDDSEPQLSPSGKQVLWVSKSNDVKGDIWVMNLNGTNKRRLTDRHGSERTPIWHPNETRIYFTARSLGDKFERIEELHLQTGVRRVMVNKGYDPAIGPAGNVLVYVNLDADYRPRLYGKNLLTHKTIPLTDGSYPAGLPFTRAPGDLTPPRETLVAFPVFFARFVDDENLDGEITLDDGPSFWSLKVTPELFATDALPEPSPLTISNAGQLFATASKRYLVYTAQGASDLNVYVLPIHGMIPDDVTPEQLLSSINTEKEPRYRRLILRYIIAHYPEIAGVAHYQLARELLQERNYPGAKTELGKAQEATQSPILRGIAHLQELRVHLQEALGETLDIQTSAQRDLVTSLVKANAEALRTHPQASPIKARSDLLAAELNLALGHRLKAVEALEALGFNRALPIEDQALALDRLASLYGRMRRLIDVERVSHPLMAPQFGPEHYIVERVAERWILAAEQTQTTSPMAALQRIASSYNHIPPIASRSLASLARHQEAAGHPLMALKQWKSLLERYPDQHQVRLAALNHIAALALKTGQEAVALESFERLIREFPEDTLTRKTAQGGIAALALKKADRASREHRLEEAYALYNRLTATNPDLVAAHRSVVRLAARLKKLPKHLQRYHRWTLKAPRNAIAHYAYGYALTYAPGPHFKEAIRSIQTSLDLQPRFAPAHLTLGWLREQLEIKSPNAGHLEKAIQSYQSARDLLIEGEDQDLLAATELNLGNAFARFGKSDSAFRAYLAREKSDVAFDSLRQEILFRINFSRVAFQEEVYEIAIDQITLASSLNDRLEGSPFLARISALTAAAYFQAELYQDALPWFTQAFEIYAQRSDWSAAIPLLRGQALSLLFEGQLSEARSRFAQLLDYLREGQRPRVTAPGLLSLAAEVPANPENITKGPRGFEPRVEREIALTQFGGIETVLGNLTEAHALLAQQLDTIQSLKADSTMEATYLPELVHSLHLNALIAVKLGRYAQAISHWSALLATDYPLSPSQSNAILSSILSTIQHHAPPPSLLELIAKRHPEPEHPPGEVPKEPGPAQKKLSRTLSLYHLYQMQRHQEPPPESNGGPLTAALGTLDVRVHHLNQAILLAKESGDRALSEKLAYLAKAHTPTPPAPPPETLHHWREAMDWYHLLAPESPAPARPYLERATALFQTSPDGAPSQLARDLIESSAQTMLSSPDLNPLWRLFEKGRLLKWRPHQKHPLPSPLVQQWAGVEALRPFPKRYSHALQTTSWLIRALEGAPPTLNQLQRGLPSDAALLQAFELSEDELAWFLISPTTQRLVTTPRPKNQALPEPVQHLLTTGHEAGLKTLYVDFGSLPLSPLPAPETEVVETLSGTYLLATLAGGEFPLEGGTSLFTASSPLSWSRRYQWTLVPATIEELPSPLPGPGRFHPVLRPQLKEPTTPHPLFGLLGDSFNSQGVVFTSAPPSAITRRLVLQSLLFFGTTRVIFSSNFTSHHLNALISMEREMSSRSALRELVKTTPALQGAHYAGEAGSSPARRVALATTRLLSLARATTASFNAANKSNQNSTDAWTNAATQIEKLLGVIDLLQREENLMLLRKATTLFPSDTPATIISTALKLPPLLNKLSLSNRQRLSQIKLRLGDVKAAVKIQQEVVEVYRRTGNKRKECEALATLGKTFAKARAFKGAGESFTQCITAAKESGHTLMEADCYSQLGSVNRDQYRYPEAKADYQTSIALYREAKAADEIYPTRHLGLLMESSFNDYPEALRLFKAALKGAIKHSVLPLQPRLHLDIARVKRQQGAYQEAIQIAQHSLRLLQSTDPSLQGEVLLELAKIYWYLGDYAQARARQTRAHQLAIETGRRFLEIQAKSLAGLIALNQGNFEEARSFVNDALLLSQKTKRLSEVAVQLNNLGSIYRTEGKWDKAQTLFARALKIDLSLNSLEGQAFDLRHMGINQTRQGLFAVAETSLQKALELSERLGNRYNELQSLFALGELYEAQNNPAQAEFFERARQLALELSNPEVLWQALYGLARTHHQAEEHSLAEAAYYRALKVVEGIEHRRPQPNARFPRSRLYGDLTTLLQTQGKKAEMFEVTERARAIRFIEGVNKATLNSSNAPARALLQEENSLRRALTESARKKEDERSSNPEQSRHLAIRARLLKEFPLLARTRFIAPTPLAELQRTLPKHWALLDYNLLGSFEAVLLISRDQIDAIPLPTGAQALETRVRELTARLSSFTSVEKELQELSEDLLGPLQERLHKVTTLIIIPAGPLTQVPFAALPFKGRPLIESFNLSYETSGWALHQHLQGPPPDKPTSITALAPSPGLPFSELEVKSLENAAVFLGEDATISRAIKASTDSLVIAAHRRESATQSSEAGLELWTRGTSAKAPVRATLGVQEILQQHGLPSLVTLSACQSWSGANPQEQERATWLPLAEAFAVGGSDTVLATQSRISDLAASLLVKRFYRYLDRSPRNEALREAALLVKSYFPHPAHWATFVLIGDPR